MIRRALLGAVCVVAVSIRAAAQASPTVPPSAQVYRDLERMASLGILDTMIVGIRPITETEIVRLLTEAARNVDRNPSARAWTEPTIREYLAQFTPRKRRAIDSAMVEGVRLSSPARLAPSDLNGSIDAEINPLAAYRGGRPIVDGTTFALETAHSATIGKWLALTVNPRATLSLPANGGRDEEFDVQTISATAMLGDFAVQVGRDYAAFGQSWTGGLLMSDNAPPVDMVRVWNDQSWRLPLLSRVFGPIRGAAFVANLGTARQRYPNTRLIGYHVSGQPHPQFEIGVAVVDAMGGRGGQPATFWERFLDVIPVVDAFRTKSDFQFSNKLAGLDVRWRMPRWAGFETYAEVDADDFDGRDFKRGFLEDAGYLVGASISCVIRCGRVGLRAEYHQTGIRYYTHFDYPMAAQGLLLGDPLGPRGVGGYVTMDADAGRAGRFALQSAFEVRSGNRYRSVATGPNDVGFHFELLERRPGEKRGRVVGSWSGFDNQVIGVQLAVGAERVTNFAFEQGASRMNWLGRVAIVGRPR